MAVRFAEYKGRTYKCLYSGKTKFGMKAKLAFMDGSKEFWVDLVTVELDVAKASNVGINDSGRMSSPIPKRRGGTRTGCQCGSVEEYTKESDCWNCKHDAE